MKLSLENIKPDEGSSFKILLTPKLNEIYYWHFHPEIELVYKGAPIDVKINLDVTKLTGENGEQPCFALVPCNKPA